jgi:uncharacterized protein (DUF433 family)
MRIRVTDVLELLVAGIQPEQIISEELPDLVLADVQACLQYALMKVDHPVLRVAA